MPWLIQFCAARAAFATMFTAWSAALPLLKGEWQLTAWQAGMVQSGYHLGFLVSLFSVGFLADRLGARRTYLLTSIGAVLSSLLFAWYASDFQSSLLLYALNGLCSGGSYTPGLALIAQQLPERRGRAMGFYLAAASLGYAIGLLVASTITPLFGWRSTFLLTACGPVIGMLIGFWTLRDVPNVIHPLPDGHDNRSGLVEVLRNRPAMLSIWGYTFHAWELLGLWAWLPAFLAAAALAAGDEAGQAISQGAIYTALTYLVAVAGSIAGGIWSDRFGRTTMTLVLSIASLVCSFSFGWMLGLPLGLLITVAVFYNATGVADSSIHSTTLTELINPRFLGAAYSLRSLLGFGAGAIAPWLFGLVLDRGHGAGLPEATVWGLAWASLGLGGLLGPVAIWRLRQTAAAAQQLPGGRR